MRRRIDALGTREPTIIKQGTTRIVVQVPGLQDPTALKALLGKTATLQFKLVDVNADGTQLAKGIAPIGDQILPYPSAAGVPRAVHQQHGLYRPAAQDRRYALYRTGYRRAR